MTINGAGKVLNGLNTYTGFIFGAPTQSLTVTDGLTMQNFYTNSSSGSALFISNSTASFAGNVNFLNNTGSNGTIYANSSKLSFNGNTVFSTNTAGNEGGALYLIKLSLISAELPHFKIILLNLAGALYILPAVR